jgi:hypothetical protein
MSDFFMFIIISGGLPTGRKPHKFKQKFSTKGAGTGEKDC